MWTVCEKCLDSVRTVSGGCLVRIVSEKYKDFNYNAMQEIFGQWQTTNIKHEQAEAELGQAQS